MAAVNGRAVALQIGPACFLAKHAAINSSGQSQLPVAAKSQTCRPQRRPQTSVGEKPHINEKFPLFSLDVLGWMPFKFACFAGKYLSCAGEEAPRLSKSQPEGDRRQHLQHRPSVASQEGGRGHIYLGAGRVTLLERIKRARNVGEPLLRFSMSQPHEYSTGTIRLSMASTGGNCAGLPSYRLLAMEGPHLLTTVAGRGRGLSFQEYSEREMFGEGGEQRGAFGQGPRWGSQGMV